MENNAEQGDIRDNDTGSSDIQTYFRTNFNGNPTTTRRLAHQVGQKYLLCAILRRVKFCPDTRCNNYNVSWDIIKHFHDEHANIPRFPIELNKSYEVPLELQELEYGRNQCVAILLFPITFGPHDDHSTMPIVVLAAKIHPCGNLQYVLSHMGQSDDEEEKIMNDGDMLMIWVSGHMRALRTVLKITDAMETRRYVYSGGIHHLADNNHHPHVVLTRGNCLLVPAQYITAITENGYVPLDLHVTISVEEQDL